jgi:hypothetical protein
VVVGGGGVMDGETAVTRERQRETETERRKGIGDGGGGNSGGVGSYWGGWYVMDGGWW